MARKLRFISGHPPPDLALPSVVAARLADRGYVGRELTQAWVQLSRASAFRVEPWSRRADGAVRIV